MIIVAKAGTRTEEIKKVNETCWEKLNKYHYPFSCHAKVTIADFGLWYYMFEVG
jgi:hypothetical protein